MTEIEREWLRLNLLNDIRRLLKQDDDKELLREFNKEFALALVAWGAGDLLSRRERDKEAWLQKPGEHSFSDEMGGDTRYGELLLNPEQK